MAKAGDFDGKHGSTFLARQFGISAPSVALAPNQDSGKRVNERVKMFLSFVVAAKPPQRMKPGSDDMKDNVIVFRS
jgi:hypothetical protein